MSSSPVSLLVFNFLVCGSADLPGPPRDFKVSDVTRGTCRLTWKPPQSDGGERVKSYFIEKKTVDGKAWTKVWSNLLLSVNCSSGKYTTKLFIRKCSNVKSYSSRWTQPVLLSLWWFQTSSMARSTCSASRLRTALVSAHTLRPLMEPKPEIQSVRTLTFIIYSTVFRCGQRHEILFLKTCIVKVYFNLN